MKILITVLCSLCLLRAGETIGGGRSQRQGHYFELHGGLGEMTRLEGRVQEIGNNGALISGGLDTRLVDLNIDDGGEIYALGGSLTGKWFTLLVDYRQNSLQASGTAESEIRINVDNLFFAGRNLDYLLIPEGSSYAVDADTTWIGLGLRFTPFTLNPRGRLRFTPWLHLGAQYIESDFSIDAGSTVRLEVSGFDNRVYAVNGNASGVAELIVPEYGLGGELRFFFGDPEVPGAELAIYGTWKMLEFDGALDDIGVDDDAFDELSLSYTALELGANLYLPMGDSVDLLVGLFMEQVDSNTELNAKPSSGDYKREVDLNYTTVGLRAGLRF